MSSKQQNNTNSIAHINRIAVYFKVANVEHLISTNDRLQLKVFEPQAAVSPLWESSWTTTVMYIIQCDNNTIFID